MSEAQTNPADNTQRPVQKKREGDYPVSESFKVLEGYDILRSDKFIVALVVVESQFGRDIRLYRWQKRKDSWKVDLCRMSVASWQWDSLALKAKELMEKYELGKRNKHPQTSDEQ